MTGKQVLGWTVTGIFAVLLVIYGLMAAYRGSWALTNANAARQHQLNMKRQTYNGQEIQQGYANQSAQRAALDNDLATIQNIDVQLAAGAPGHSALVAQRRGVAGDACKAAVQIVQLGTDYGWVHRNCSGGALSATSPIARAR